MSQLAFICLQQNLINNLLCCQIERVWSKFNPSQFGSDIPAGNLTGISLLYSQGLNFDHFTPILFLKESLQWCK